MPSQEGRGTGTGAEHSMRSTLHASHWTAGCACDGNAQRISTSVNEAVLGVATSSLLLPAGDSGAAQLAACVSECSLLGGVRVRVSTEAATAV